MRVYVNLLLSCIFIILCCGPCQAAYFLGLERTDCAYWDQYCSLQLKNVSADGSTAVGYVVDNGDPEVFIQPDGRQPIANGPSWANAVSGDGSVVVGNCTEYGYLAFRWTVDGGRVDLWEGEAWDISNDGSVVVGITILNAVRWTESTGLEYLGDLSGAEQSCALAVSGNGSTIVGYSGDQAFRWTDSEGMQPLNLMGPHAYPVGFHVSSSRANDVSTNGSVIVGHVTSGVFHLQKQEAFRYTRLRIWGSSAYVEHVTKLGHLPGTSESCAYGVSGDGTIVVGQSGDQAFIWDKTNGMRKLADVLVDEYGLDLKGWNLEKAIAISADGLTIIGDDWIADISDDCPPYEFGANACTRECPCDSGQGICHSDAECDPGLVCEETLPAPFSRRMCGRPPKTP